MRNAWKRVPIGLWAAALVYVVFRLLVLLTSFEDVVMAMFEQYPMGTMAKLALDGVDFPVRFYYDNAAGQLVMGHLAIPFYALFGSSYFVLKCIPALLGLATLFLLWDLLDKHFSRVAANVGAFLFAIAPSTLVRYSVVCSGNHFENLFFTTLFLWLFYRHHGITRTRRSLFQASFGAGLALFVFLGAIIPVGICAGMHAGLRGLRRTLSDAPVAIAGFFLGILPLILVNMVTSGRGLGFLSAKFQEGAGAPRQGTIGERVQDFLGAGLVESGMFETTFGITTTTLGFVFVGVFAIAYLASLPGCIQAIGRLLVGAFGRGAAPEGASGLFEDVKLVPFVLYVPLAAVAFGIANFRLRGYQAPMVAGGYRYYLPTLLFALVLIAVWTARGWERRGAWRVASVSLGGVALACCATSFQLIDWTFSRYGAGLRYEGYNYAQIGRGLASRRNGLTRAEIVAQIREWPDEVRWRVVRSLGFNFGLEEYKRSLVGTTGDGVVEIENVLAEFPLEWHRELAFGLGTHLRWQLNNAGQPGKLPELLRKVEPASGPFYDEVVAGSAQAVLVLPIGRESFDWFSQDVQLLEMDLPNKPAFRRGLGIYCGRLRQRGNESEVAFVEEYAARTQDPDFQAGFTRGQTRAER